MAAFSAFRVSRAADARKERQANVWRFEKRQGPARFRVQGLVLACDGGFFRETFFIDLAATDSPAA
jgi:hypothetical protein